MTGVTDALTLRNHYRIVAGMTHRSVSTAAAWVIGAVFALGAALGAAQETETPTGRLAVVATTNIVGDIVARVGGDRISLYVMLPHGADPHAFRATPRDARQVADAAVVFINGAGLEENFMGDLADNAAPGSVVDLSANLDLRSMSEDEHGHHDEGEEHDEHDEGEEHEEHDEDEGHDDHDEDEEHDEDEDEHDEDEHDEHEDEEGHHHHGGLDPHVWMDPTLVAAWAGEIAAVLSGLDAASASAYAGRAAELAAELDALDAWVRGRVAGLPADRRIMITDHDVFGYFADRYGFTVLDTVIPGVSTVAEPSARHLAELREEIAEHNAPAIFVGDTVDARVARSVADDVGIEVVPVYTGSLSGASGPAATYVDFIRTNVERIVSALE